MKKRTMSILLLLIISLSKLATATQIEADDKPHSPILTENSDIKNSNSEEPLDPTREKKICKSLVMFT